MYFHFFRRNVYFQGEQREEEIYIPKRGEELYFLGAEKSCAFFLEREKSCLFNLFKKKCMLLRTEKGMYISKEGIKVVYI